MTKPHDQEQLGGEERLSFILQFLVYHLRKLGRTSRQEQKQRPWRNAAYWLAFHGLLSAFLQHPGQPAKGHSAHELGQATPIINQENALQAYPKADVVLTSSCVILAFVKLPLKTSCHSQPALCHCAIPIPYPLSILKQVSLSCLAVNSPSWNKPVCNPRASASSDTGCNDKPGPPDPAQVRNYASHCDK